MGYTLWWFDIAIENSYDYDHLMILMGSLGSRTWSRNHSAESGKRTSCRNACHKQRPSLECTEYAQDWIKRKGRQQDIIYVKMAQGWWFCRTCASNLVCPERSQLEFECCRTACSYLKSRLRIPIKSVSGVNVKLMNFGNSWRRQVQILGIVLEQKLLGKHDIFHLVWQK